MIDLNGKGMFTWVIQDCEGGNISEIIKRANEAQFTFLMPKIADGTAEYSTNSPYLAEFVSACHANGIKVIAWQFVYGNYPEMEGVRAVKELKKYPYDGFVINAEGAYKNKPEAADIYCSILRSAFPDLFLGLSSFRYPDYHPEFPWNEFLKYVDVNMPQVYWEKADGTAASQLDRCLAVFSDSKYIQRPIMPTGAAYPNDGWVAKAPDVVDFIERANELELDAISFWEWRYPRDRFPNLWDAIVDTPFGNYEEPNMPDQIWTGKYKIVMKGSLKKHTGPSYESPVTGTGPDDYVYAGNVLTGYERSPLTGYMRIEENEQVWISGSEKYSTITKILKPVEPEPDPEPEETFEQMIVRRIEALEVSEFGEVQQ